jgi:fatty-acyl-CoA synthase
MDWLERWATYSPAAIAFQDADSDARYTYSEIYHLSCVLASHLRETYGISRGDRVAILSFNELEYVALFFACQRLGAMIVPVNFRLAAPEVDHVLRDSEPKLLVLQESFLATFKLLKNAPANVWFLDGAKSVRDFTRTRLAEFHSSGLRVDRAFVGDFDDACMILYTSGTTGLPKGALITNKMLHWNSLNTGLRLNLQQHDVALGFLPFFHTSGWNVLVTPFVHRGARTILMRKFDPDRVLELSEREGVTVIFGVPTIMEMMARSPRFESCNLTRARYAIVGGEPMPIELIRTWQKKGIPIRQGYGLTEFGPGVFSLNEEDAIRKIGSIGFPNFYVEARVVGPSRREVGVDQIGELVLRGDVCSPGYWRNEAATAAAIRDGWFHTGDLVRRDSEGYYYVAGRKKEMFISGGENVYPVEIERLLSTHPAIREVAVVGVPDAKWGEVGKAVISLKAGSMLSEQDVTQFCLQGLAKYKVPKQIQFMDDLPKGDSGKILKRALL